MKTINNIFERVANRFAEILRPAIEKVIRDAINHNVVEIVRVNVKPGDYLALKVKKRIGKDVYNHLSVSLKDLFPQNKILILEEDMDILAIEMSENQSIS